MPTSNITRAGSAALCGLVLAALPARAQAVRDFAPNRPSRSDSPFTVPAGYLQIETDLANYTHPGNLFQTLDPLLIYGVSSRTDIEAAIGGLVQQKDRGAIAQGFGDVVVRAKINLLGDDGGDVTASLIPYVKIPTARAPIGNGQVEGGLDAPILFNLPFEFGLSVEPEAAVLKNSVGNGKQASFTGVVNLGRHIVGNLSGFVEIYDQTYTDRRATSPDVTFDYGLAYLLTRTVQLDVGANVGLNRATPALNVYTGLAFRF